MNRTVRWWPVGVMLACGLAGCRSATRIASVPRIDVELSGGNRGYVVGSPPPASTSPKTTRDIVETEVEIPSFYRPRRGHAGPVGLGEVAPPEIDLSEEGLMPAGVQPEIAGAYVVKPGDTLWSIAANPAVFGDATKWRRLYEANRDLLKSPDQLRPGMTLKIPASASGSRDVSTESTTATK